MVRLILSSAEVIKQISQSFNSLNGAIDMKLEMLNQAGLNGFNSLNGAIDIRLFPAMRGDSTSFNSLNGAIDI